jgi:hypothetical protein
MAIYMSRVKTFPRSKGARVTRAAAYRAGERIRDERSGQVYSYLDRQDVARKEIIVPSEFAGNAAISWTQDRATLWNAVERTERCNAQLGREVMVVLPGELSPQQRIQLTREYAQDLADRYRCAVDMAIHLPRPDAGERNHHAHLLMTPRQVTPDGLGPRTSFGLSGRERRALGLCNRREDLLWQRERWATVANKALEAAGLSARIDHCARRSLERKPELRLPLKIYKIERESGRPSQVGEALRRQHRERVAAWVIGPAELARVKQRQKEEAHRALIKRDALELNAEKRLSRAVFNKEELNQQRREQYHLQKAREREIEARMTPAQRSAQEWLKWRKRHPEIVSTPEQSVQNWRAYREAELMKVTSDGMSRELSHDWDARRKGKKLEQECQYGPEKDRDYGLEL